MIVLSEDIHLCSAHHNSTLLHVQQGKSHWLMMNVAFLVKKRDGDYPILKATAVLGIHNCFYEFK